MRNIKIKRLIILLGLTIILITGLQQVFAITNEHGSTVPPVTVSWTAPTEYLPDNSKIQQNDLVRNEIYVQCNNRAETIYSTLGSATSYVLPAKEIGLCRIKVRAIATNSSDWSVTILKLIKLNKVKKGGFR